MRPFSRSGNYYSCKLHPRRPEGETLKDALQKYSGLPCNLPEAKKKLAIVYLLCAWLEKLRWQLRKINENYLSTKPVVSLI